MNQPNTIEEALELTFEKLGELQQQGIKVRMKPSNSRHREETVEKYNQPGRLKPAYWFHVNLEYEQDDHSKLIYSMADDLRSVGIGFDTGGMGKQRDWELDWSFHLDHINSKSLNNMTERRGIVEDLIGDFNENGNLEEMGI